MGKTNKKIQVVNEIHKPLRKNFIRRKTVIRALNESWQADLTILDSIAKYNDGFKYLLCVIDNFSKFAYIQPLKSKTGKEVAEAFAKIFKKSKTTPKNIHTDQGTEFFNPHVKQLFKKHNINLFHTYTKIKAAIVERFQRTFKARLFKSFHYNGNYRYIDNLQQMVDDYNNTPHRGINKMKPNSITTKAKEKLLLSTVYNRPKIFTKTPKFKVGDYVRIADYKGVFDKGYEPNFSTAVFIITKVQITNPVTYKVMHTETKENLNQGFYEYELTKVKYPNVYLIKKIIKRKNNKAYVSWLGYSSKFNSWVDIKDIV